MGQGSDNQCQQPHGSTLTLPSNRDLLKAKFQMGTNRLMRVYLDEFEALLDEHDEAMSKLHEALPEQYKSYVSLADYVTEEKVAVMRANVLRAGNDMIRDVSDLIDLLERHTS